MHRNGGAVDLGIKGLAGGLAPSVFENFLKQKTNNQYFTKKYKLEDPLILFIHFINKAYSHLFTSPSVSASPQS